MDFKGVAIALLVGGLVVVGGYVWSQEREKQHGEKGARIVAMAVAAAVSIEQAIAIAIDSFPGHVIEAELELQDDRAVWAVEVATAEQRIMLIQINAESGSVIDTVEKTTVELFEQESKKKQPVVGKR